MTNVPEELPPKWLQNMQERRACLFRYKCETPLSVSQARSVALALIVQNGTGKWECTVVDLDDSGTDWEFRFRPARPGRPQKGEVRN